MTGLKLFHDRFDLPLPGVLHTEAPYFHRRGDRSMSEREFSAHCADELERTIRAEGPDTVAAFSAYAPLSGSIVSERMWKVLEEGTDRFGPIGHGWAYSAHPIGAVAGVANLKLVDAMGLIGNAGTVGASLQRQMRDALANHPNVGEVRGEGMLCAVELVEDRDDRRFFDPSRMVGPAVVAAILKRGVIARAMPEGDILGFAPPLCLTEDEAALIVEATVEAVAEVLG